MRPPVSGAPVPAGPSQTSRRREPSESSSLRARQRPTRQWPTRALRGFWGGLAVTAAPLIAMASSPSSHRVAWVQALHARTRGWVALSHQRQHPDHAPGSWSTSWHEFDGTPQALASVCAKLDRLAPGRASVFLSALSFAEPQRRARLACPAYSAWVDVDLEPAQQALQSFVPVPHWVIQTSPGRVQAGWRLADPTGPQVLHEAHRRLARHLGADLQAIDPSRQLSVPASRNGKYAGAPVTQLLSIEPGASIALAELLSSLPRDEPRPAPTPVAPVSTPPAAVRALTAKPGGLRDAVRALRALPLVDAVPDLLGQQPTPAGYLLCPLPHPASPTGRDRNPRIHGDHWHCYGCGRHGDLLALQGELAALGPAPRGQQFRDVVEALGQRFGIRVAPAPRAPSFPEASHTHPPRLIRMAPLGSSETTNAGLTPAR